MIAQSERKDCADKEEKILEPNKSQEVTLRPV